MSTLPLLYAAALATASAADTTDWSETIDQVVPGVVSIRTDFVRSFDMESAGNMVATGFVVDLERGILLTNRHVVGPGPATAEAVLLDHEEIELQPLYRDPVHDFGFYRFDPSDVRFMELAELPLAPERAAVGTEVRVIGNDAGEKLSILEGTLARLDRNAPSYGRGRFNDFNTFYYQAASGTSGGSSGSPVIDSDGHVIALNAGGSRRAASSFYLPLDRIVRALEYVQRGEPVPRGTLQTTFEYTSFDEVRRLGVSADQEGALREAQPEAEGLLVVKDTVPLGPADGRLRPGDVVTAVNGAPLAGFVPLEAAIDDAVGQAVTLSVLRGGQSADIELTVQDLHSVAPSGYLEFSGGILHPLSYQQARSYALPAQGVVVASAGYALAEAGIGVGDLILEVDGRPTPDLDALAAALADIPDLERVPVRAVRLSDPQRQRLAAVRVDHRWFPMQRCHRDDATGVWPCETVALTAKPRAPGDAGATPPVADDKVGRALARSLVAVDFDLPVRSQGVYGSNFRGTGVVVDTERGWVVVDRDTVPVALGDASITFGGTLTVPGQVEWIHPGRNLALVSYDPAAIGDTPVEAAEIDPRPLEKGDRVWQVGLSQGDQLVSKGTAVERLRPVGVPMPSPPFFRQTNLEVVETESAARSMGGVLADKKGRVRALWASFVDLSGKEPDAWFSGVPARHVTEMLELVRAGEQRWPAPGVELVPVGLAMARDLGLDDRTAQALAELDRDRVVLGVARIAAGSPAADVLRDGDLLLAVDGELVTTFDALDASLADGAAELTILRGGERVDVTLEPWWLEAGGIDRVVGFAGALLHAPHAAVAAQRGFPREGVYVAWYWYGSPAARFGLRPTRRIVAVDGQPVADIDAFLAAVGARAAGDSVRLETVDLQGRREVLTLQLDPTYWPTYQLLAGEDGWRREDVR